MKQIACIIAYAWLGCLSFAWSARHDFDGVSKDRQGIVILVVPFWPVYWSIAGAFFIVDHIPSFTCASCACGHKDQP